MEPLENRALLAVDAFGGAASLAESNVEESWGPAPAPTAFSASVLATDAEVIDVSGVNATSAAASFSVQAETPEPVAPPSFEQLMEALGQVKIESLDDESDAASLSYLDANDAAQVSETQAEARQVVFYDSSAADFDASTLNLDDESVYYVDAANAGDAESYSVTPRSGGESGDSGGSGGSSSSGGSSNSGGTGSSGGSNPGVSNSGYLTTYGSSTIHESATFTGSGGSDQVPYFGFTTPAIPSGCWAYVRFEGGDAEYGKDYVVRCATIDENGVVTPNMNYVSGGAAPNNAYDIYVYGPATYCVVPLNDFDQETHEDVVATLYFDMLSGGSDVDPPPVAYDSFTATIIDDDPSNLSVYWRNGSDPTTGATLSGNPNGGGFRVFPEKIDATADCARDQVDVVFRLSASSSTDTVIHYKVLDPDNYISLGANQAADVNYAGGDNHYTPVFQGSVTIPANQLEAVESFVISDAYAGDNFIVVADTDSSVVASAALGTTAETRYQVVQPANNKPAYSPLLTVWRTLWVECDQIDNFSFPIIAEIAANAFGEAQIQLAQYSQSTSSTTIEATTVTYPLAPDEKAAMSEMRAIPQATPTLWTVHAIGGSQERRLNSSTGNYQITPAVGRTFDTLETTIIVYNSAIESTISTHNENFPNNQVSLEVAKEIVACHELGHLFVGGNHYSGTIMNYKLDYNFFINPTWRKFGLNQIRQIQACRYPSFTENTNTF